MENTGTWNADYAILFFGVLVAPFFLYFLGRFLALATEMSTQRRVVVSPPQETEPIKISIDFCNIHEKSKSVKPKPSKPSKSGKSHSRPIQSKPTPVKKETPKKPKINPLEPDAISALCGLGIKKTDAKNLVRSLCSKKEYNSLDSLINDCFMCINKS
jgi:hypothetical protein